MPPIYDDYIDESGFGEVVTLFNAESTILEEVAIDYDENKVATYDDYYDDIYAIKSNKFFMLLDHEKNALCDCYMDESIHDAIEN